MATYNWKGTYIKGTGSTIWVSLGNNQIAVNHIYLNTNTGYVYRCTEVETKTVSRKVGNQTVKETVKTGRTKWTYVRCDIIGKPNFVPTKVAAPVRYESGSNTRMCRDTWGNTKWMTDAKNPRRAQGLEYQWTFDVPGPKNPYRVLTGSNPSQEKSEINLTNFPIGKKTYKRQSFYPCTKRKLYGMGFRIRFTNEKGKGDWVSQYRKFYVPRIPSLSGMTFDEKTGKCTVTITTNAGKDYYERYDTVYKCVIYSSLAKKTTYNKTFTTTKTTQTFTFDATNYNRFGSGDYYKLTISAYARGYAGNSKTVKKSYWVAFPNVPAITGVTVSSKRSDGHVIVKFNNKVSGNHPISGVRLQYLTDSEATKVADIPANANWQDFDVQDDGNCATLSIPVNTCASEDGKNTWVRVKTWHLYESVLYRTSTPYRVAALFTPAPVEGTAADDYAEILTATAGEDGKSATVLIGWNKNGKDDSTGTEVTWSKDEDAWKSTEEPKSFNMTWNDGKVVHKGTTYKSSATLHIKDLDEGEKYYIKARRYREGSTTTYSKYSSTATVVTSEEPSAVSAVCLDTVSSDASLTVQWTFTGNGLQKEWQVVNAGGQVIESGIGSINSTQITASRLQAFAVNDVVTFSVKISTGSGYVESSPLTVTIVTRPQITANVEPTLAVQPLRFGVTTSQICDVVAIVYSQGVVGQFPTGVERQAAGDTIYSDVYTPTWWATNAQMALTSDVDVDTSKTYYVLDPDGVYYIGDSVYSTVPEPTAEDISTYYEMSVPDDDDGTLATVVVLPQELDFWDNGDYTLSVVGIDRTTGMKSDESLISFKTAWAHQAVDPTEAVTVTPLITVDDDGTRHIQAQIELTPPEGSIESDYYDLYRLVGGKAYLIGERYPLTYTAIDEYAPFGEDMALYYRIALRTIDGDMNYTDVEYSHDINVMKFDWAGMSVEFPYNLSVGEQYAKSVDVRQHMDGSNDAYWNKNVEHKASLSTSVIKLVQPEEVMLARNLARHAGSIFVRLPNGQAFEADVQVTDLSGQNKQVTAIAIDATEIGLTQEFMLPPPNRTQEETE